MSDGKVTARRPTVNGHILHLYIPLHELLENFPVHDDSLDGPLKVSQFGNISWQRQIGSQTTDEDGNLQVQL